MPVDASTIDIVSADIDRPGLELTGYLDFFDSTRIMILGYTEYSYLNRFGAEQQHHVLNAIFHLVHLQLLLLVICDHQTHC